MLTPDRFSDLRVLRWFDRIDQAISGESVVGPIRVNIDLENACQHNCPWCEPVAFRESTIADKNHTLSTQAVLSVLADLSEMDCRVVNLSGGGEPLLHREFGLILRTIANRHMKSWIVTNGGLIHKWFNDLLLADHIRISLDASNQEEHQLMHGSNGKEFDRVCANIVELCKRRINGTPEVGISYLVSDDNASAQSFERIFTFAENAGVDFIHFRPLSEETPNRWTGDWELMSALIESYAKQHTAVQCFPLGKRGKDVFLQRDFETCYASLTTAVISANGEVCACCDRRDLVWGNVNEQPFRHIWLSAKHRALAEAIVPQLCSRCLMCSFNKSVERFVVGNEALPELI